MEHFFEYTHTSLVPADFFTKKQHLLQPVYKNLLAAQELHYNSFFASTYLPFDTQYYAMLQELVAQKKKLDPAVIFVIGIGGSNLGAQAIYAACKKEDELSLYFVDTVLSDQVAHYLQMMRTLLDAKKTVLLLVISKSGTTLETLANFQCMLAVIQQYHPQTYAQYVIAITDKSSPLHRIARTTGFSIALLPTMVGGRYSIFSAVGMVPLLFTTIDVDALRAGAQQAVHETTKTMLHDAAISALISAYYYSKSIRIHDTFIFDSSLEFLGKWYRQLLAESIGKEYSVSKKEVHCGITPTVSIGSADLHSMAQLYLGGPYDRFTTFITIGCPQQKILVPHLVAFEKIVPHIQGKSLQQIMQSIITGVQHAYLKGSRPFMTITLPEKNEFNVGYILQWKMIEVMYLGALLEVNPFDQPEVEWYKKYTKDALAKMK